MDLAAACYELTRDLPREEMFGLTAQVRRAAGSVPANIAEGHGRENTGSFIQYLRIAQGSLKELETHILLASKVGLLSADRIAPVLDTCGLLGKRIRSLIRSLQERARSSS